MKDKGEKTKVIVRNLPPSLAENSFLELLDKFLCNRYSWSWFCQGKSRQSRQLYSRAYVNLKSHEDVLSLYDNIDGRVFINERGVQYKALVEYAPFQRVPKPRIKKDARDGTIYKDADYAAFLESLEKVQEMLPSAEVQLERREAEKAAAVVAGGGKEPVIVTPLMEFVRNKRAAKSAPVPRVLATRQPKSSAAATGSSQKKERFRGDADKERASGEKRRKDPLSEGKERRVPKDFSPGSVNFKSAGASGYSHLRVDDDSAQPSSSSSTLAEAAAAGGGSRGGSTALPSPSASAHVAISSIIPPDGGPSTPTPAKESGRREGSKRQRQREREREKEAAAIAVAAAAAATGTGMATATAMAGAGAGAAGDGAPKSPATATAASLHSPHRRASQRAPLVHKVVESSSAASRPQLSSHSHHHQHHHDGLGGTTQAGFGSSTSHGSEASSESRRLRNKDRPDRPVWTPRRRGDGAPVTAAAAAAGGSNSMTTSVGSAGGKAGGGSAALVGQGIPLQPGSVTILRRDSRKAGISGQGQQSPGTEQAVTAGDGNVENSGGACRGISLSLSSSPSLGPSTSTSTLAPSPSAVMPSSSSSSAPAAAPAAAPPPPPRGRSGGKKGGQNVQQQQQMLNTTVLMAGPSPADPSQGGVKGVEVASGRRGGRGGRVPRNAGDNVNPSATSSSSSLSSDHYQHRDGGGSERKVEGSKHGLLGKGNISSAAAKDGSGRRAGSTNGHNGMPPS